MSTPDNVIERLEMKRRFAMKQIALYLVICTTILALLIAGCSSAAASTATVSAPPTPALAADEPAPTALTNGLVDVGGRKLMVHCTGQGSPTVILEAGSGTDSRYWVQVQSSSDRSYRVCSYDRANLGDSDPAPTPRTYLDMARDLHALLVNAHIDGPYILVGHSGGGMIVRVFRDQYPEDVAGLVLVDAGHPDMGARLLAGLPPKSLFEAKAIREWRIWLSWMSDSHGSLYKDREGLDNRPSNKQVKAAKPLGDLPLVVISRSPDNATMEGALPLSAEDNAKLRQIWQDMQRELAGLSSSSTHIIASHSGHMIPTEEPELITAAIGKLVNEWRGQMGVTIPAAQPADQTEAAHAPRILRVEEWQETREGRAMFHKDVYYTDSAGDVVLAMTPLVSADPPMTWAWPGGFVSASADKQKQEAMDTTTWVCFREETVAIEVQFIDQAFNRSEPMTFTFICPAPHVYISPMLIIGIVTGLGLLAAASWLLVRYVNRHRRGQRVAAIPA
jgi:pimeloyl-ACP methyl ester carboxylesterase